MLDAVLKTQPPTEQPTLTMSDVSDLSQADIRQMTGEELIAVIQTADIPLFREKMIRHLPFYDHSTLEQLAFLAQRTAKNLGY